MKQINYFKFLEKYPEFIDVDEEEPVKLILLSVIKKKYWFKKEGEIARLLPMKFSNNHNIFYNQLKIKYRKVNIAVIWKDDRNNIINHLWTVGPNVYTMMKKEEITNLKREILMETMTK